MEESKQDQNSEVVLALAIDAFKKNATVMGLGGGIIDSVQESLSLSTLSTLELRGGKCGFRMEDEHVGIVASCLQQARVGVIALSLTYHRITGAGVEYISRSLLGGIAATDSIKLSKLDLEGNDIKEDGLRHLQLHNSSVCPLLCLNVSGNPLGEEGGMVIADSMKTNTTLQELIVNNCGFPLTAMIAIANGIGSQGSDSVLRSLEINRPIVPQYAPGEESLEHFSMLLGRIPNLSHLSFKYHAMLDSGARLLGQSLGKTDVLLSLNLECNKIGVAGAEALASYLIAQSRAGKNTLEILRMSSNFVSDEGAIALADAILQNNSLRCLTLKSNSIAQPGLAAIGDAISKNNTLQYLSIFGNDFSVNAVGKQFHDLIDHRLPYTGLELDVKTYVVDGVYQVAEV